MTDQKTTLGSETQFVIIPLPAYQRTEQTIKSLQEKVEALYGLFVLANGKEYLTPKEAYEKVLGVSKTTFYHLLKAARRKGIEIREKRFGERGVRYHRNDLMKLAGLDISYPAQSSTQKGGEK